MTLPLPIDTVRAAQSAVQNCKNLGLRYAKYPQWLVQDGSWQFRSEEKRLWFNSLIQTGSADGQLLDAAVNRAFSLIQARAGIHFERSTLTPLVVGLGGNSVVETGLTCHPLYGFPFIPGTTLKGLARTVALVDLATSLGVPLMSDSPLIVDIEDVADTKTPLSRLDNILIDGWPDPTKLTRPLTELQALLPAGTLVGTMLPEQFLQHPKICRFRSVFGHLARAGAVVFFDALPTAPPPLAIDVMNPHFAEYYMDTTNSVAPTDDMKLIPVPFLTIAPGVGFRFGLSLRDNRMASESPENAATWIDAAREWLVSGLTEVGIGGKTTSGYGLFAET